MIIEGILKLIDLVLTGIVAIIPDFSVIALPEGFMDWFGSTVALTAYVLPLADFFAMFGIWLVFVNWSIIWKVIQRIWDALPFT